MKQLSLNAIILLAGGLIVHLGFFLLLPLDEPNQETLSSGKPEIVFVGDLELASDPVLQEKALLQDTAPIFMPTRWNPSSHMESVASLRQAAEVFTPFEASISLPESLSLPASLEPDQEGPFARAYAQDPVFVLDRFAEVPIPEAAPGGIDRRVEVTVMSSRFSEETKRLPLPEDISSDAPEALWNPVRIYLQMHEGKILGRPVVSRSSGFGDWDQSLQAYFASIAFYRHLEDGYYRLLVYP